MLKFTATFFLCSGVFTSCLGHSEMMMGLTNFLRQRIAMGRYDRWRVLVVVYLEKTTPEV